MTTFIATVTVNHGMSHNPMMKKVGNCPLAEVLGVPAEVCTDTTGRHHSTLVHASSIREARERLRGIHITRIEEVSS